MHDPSRVLFVTRYYWPELIGSAPFSTDIAEWLAAHGRPTTVVSGLPHYPHVDIFPAYRNGKCLRETICGVEVERLRSADDSRLRQELGQRGREFVEQHYAKPQILGHLMSRLDAVVAEK